VRASKGTTLLTQQQSEPEQSKLQPQDDETKQPSLDDILDHLTPKQRQTVLLKLGIIESEEPLPKLKGMTALKWNAIMFGSFIWLLLWSLITILLFCTIIFAPFGVCTWIIANSPMVYLGSKRRVARITIFEKSQKET
jgi:hypothetical protein